MIEVRVHDVVLGTPERNALQRDLRAGFRDRRAAHDRVLILHRFTAVLSAGQFHCDVDTTLLVTDHALTRRQVHALDRRVDELKVWVGCNLDAARPQEHNTDNGRGNERNDNDRE